MNDSAKAKKGILDSLSGILFKTKQDPNAAGQSNFSASTTQLNTALERLQKTLEKKREEAQALATSHLSSDVSVASENSGLSAKEIEQKEHEAAVLAMREAVFKKHLAFGSDFNESKLEELQNYFETFNPVMSGTELDNRMKAAIIKRCLKETGPLAWKVLETYMKKSNKAWPEPDSLALGNAQEEHKKSQDYRLAEAREIFCAQDLKNAVANMGGQVMAWKRYPSVDSWLWKDVELRCVASGIRCQFLQLALEKLKSESESLRNKAQELIQETMSQIQSVLDSGVKSLEQADQVIQGTDVIVNEVLPELAWQIAAPVVDLEVKKLLA